MSKIMVNNNGYSISVFALADDGEPSDAAEPWPRALASADLVGDRWWVSRVIVRKVENRGQGIGSAVLSRLLLEVSGHPCTRVCVSPSGYDQHPKQRAFYLKHGFKPTDEPDLLEWNPSSPG